MGHPLYLSFIFSLTYYRVATDLENLEKSGNLKETSESQGICLKSQGICDKIGKVREFCRLKFIYSQVEDLNFENFPLNCLGLTVELNLGLEKSGKSPGISYCLESGNPVIIRHDLVMFQNAEAKPTVATVVELGTVCRVNST